MTTLAPPPAAAAPPPRAEFEAALRAAVRGQVAFDEVTRGIYATDASHYQVTPACVFVPRDEADCVAGLRVAHAHRVAVTARGAATALSGQTFGPGMVVDVSKHLDQVVEVHADQDPATGKAIGGWARVQPGVVRDRLNQRLAADGLQFAPDPATGSRATVGGMLGNNSSGTRSIVYGKTSDHTLASRFALIDGTVIEAAAVDDATWQRRAAGQDVASPREAQLYRGVRDVVLRHQDAIKARYPRVMRRVAGYNLDAFVDGAGYVGPIGDYDHTHGPGQTRRWNLTQLIVGSEGTLGFLLECTIRLIPLPAATTVCVVHFDDDLEALRTVPTINAQGPSAVELLDRRVLREARINPTTQAMAHWIQGDPGAVLQVELTGDSAEHAAQRAHDFAESMKTQGVGYAHPVMLEATSQRDVWETRKLGLGLISNVRGPVKGQAFVEDACVPVEHLADYIGKLQDKCRELDLDYTSYAHASVGVIHFRPSVDLHRPDHRDEDAAGRRICLPGNQKARRGVLRRARRRHRPRHVPPRLLRLRGLRGVPRNQATLRPAPPDEPGQHHRQPADDRRRTAALRRPLPHRRGARAVSLPRSSPPDQPTHGFRGAVEQCNGVGACRKLGSGTMCPSYMATRDEQDTTRGRANALRLAMSGQLGEHADDVTAALASDGVHEVLELCLSCKACKNECPNAVDMSRLKADALQIRHDQNGVPLGYKLIGRMPDIAPWMKGPAAWAGRQLDRFGPYRVVFEKLTGIDRRRPLPGFAGRHLPALLRARRQRQVAAARRQSTIENQHQGVQAGGQAGHEAEHEGGKRGAGQGGVVQRHLHADDGAAAGRGGGGTAGRLRVRGGAGQRGLLPTAAAVQGPGPRSQVAGHPNPRAAGRIRPPGLADRVPRAVVRLGTARRPAGPDR